VYESRVNRPEPGKRFEDRSGHHSLNMIGDRTDFERTVTFAINTLGVEQNNGRPLSKKLRCFKLIANTQGWRAGR
jgi:hypothetical protein